MVSAEPLSHETRTLRCLQKEMATYRHWSVSLWQDPENVPHCQILSPDKTEWRLTSATLCGWRRCFVADQLWFMTCIWEEEEEAELMGWLGVSCRLAVCLSWSVIFYLNCFFCLSLSLIFMKLGVNDVRARGYKVTERILNICINYANLVKGAHRTHRSY